MIPNNVTRYFQKLLVAILAVTSISTASFAGTYYVATDGSDTNPGTLNSPFKTIQTGIDVLEEGDTCYVRGGTYNEGLVLKQSGTSSAPITIKNYNGETVTVNSGNVQAVRTGGRRHYYTIDGLGFISNHVTYSNGKHWSLDFEDGIWDGFTNPTGGNNGFILSNCYIEGSVHFYGHNILVENCEVNGRNQWTNGVADAYTASHDNTYQYNTVYGFTQRGFWSLQYTNNVTIENNIIHDVGNAGIDFDGAGYPDYNCIARGNIIYNVGGRGIELENAFNGIVEGNIIHDSDKWAISLINYGPGIAHDEWRDDDTNTIVRNNLVYNTAEGGIVLHACPGVKIYNNTVYRNNATPGYYAGISLVSWDGFYCVNTDIQNNIVAQCKAYAIWIDSTTVNLQGLVMNNNLYYHSTNTKTHYVSDNGSYTLAQFQSASGEEPNSLFANPGFVDVSDSNFHLTGNSPAKDAGTTLPAVTTDLDGIARPQGANYDIGAYEIPATQAPLSQPQDLRIVN